MLARTIAGHKGDTQEFQDQLSSTDAWIKVVQRSIGELVASVAKATEIRQKQHAEFVTLTAKKAATQLLKLAVNTLNRLAPKAYLSADDRIYVNMGGEVATAAPAGFAGTRVVQLFQADAPDPFASELEKNHEGYGGVTSLAGSLIADLAKESQEAKVEQDHSLEKYEAFLAESSASRAEKEKEVEEWKDTRASVSPSLVNTKEKLASAVTSAAETAELQLAASEC